MRALTLIALSLSVTFAGCGSASRSELPPAAGPDRAPALTQEPVGEALAPATTTPAAQTRTTLRDGSLIVTLDPQTRTLTVNQRARSGAPVATLPVGVGPTQVACAPEGPCYVVDTQGDALLVVRVGEGGRGTRLTRRVYVAGAPYGIALDPERRRLWITLTARNELVELPAHGRPHILGRLPTIRQPDGVSVDPSSGDVTVLGADGSRQRLRDPASGQR